MASDAAMIRSFMARLVDKAGGVEPAAALIGARLGNDVCKGTISKRMAGHLEWPLVEILALERALGDPCVSRWLAGSVPEIAQSRDLMSAVADAVREHGEAVAAVMSVAMGRGNMADARRELHEASQAMVALTATLGGLGGAA